MLTNMFRIFRKNCVIPFFAKNATYSNSGWPQLLLQVSDLIQVLLRPVPERRPSAEQLLTCSKLDNEVSTSVVDPNQHGSAFILVGCIQIRVALRIRIRIQEDQNEPQKWRKFKFWSARCSLLRDEDFSCSLCVLYGGLGISKLQFLIKKISALDFDPEPALTKNAESGTVSGSATNADPQHWLARCFFFTSICFLPGVMLSYRF
jgi:hypothetical protein